MKFKPFLSLLILCACTGQPEQKTPDYETEISNIESGLRPALVIDGDVSGFSIPERMRFYNVPGLSIAFIENGEIKWTKTYGHLSFDSASAVDEYTRFQAASISKPVAASGMLTLVEAGKLDLSENVNKYMSDWQVADNPFTETEKVTLERLVTHNAGLTVHGFRGYAEGEEVPTTVQVLNGDGPANSDPILPDTLPGSIWRYSGGGYTVMQHVVEEQAGTSFPAFMRTTVLEPLRMDRSTYEQPLPAGERENVAIGYRGDGTMVEGKWHTYPEIAAAGLWTTPSDLARWAVSIQKSYNGAADGILSPEMTRQMLTPHMNDWGLGPGLGGAGDSLYFSHGGANEGYRCFLMAYAKEGGQGVAIMTNGDRGGPLGNEVLRSVDREYGWGIFKSQEKSTITLTEEELAVYEGTFRAGDFEVVMSMDGKGLKGVLNGDRQVILLPEGNDQFFDSDDGTGITFTRDENNEVSGFDAAGMQFVRAEE